MSRKDTPCSGWPAGEVSTETKRVTSTSVCAVPCQHVGPLLPCRTWNSQTQEEFEAWGKAGHCWSCRWSPHHNRSHPGHLWPLVDSKNFFFLADIDNNFSFCSICPETATSFLSGIVVALWNYVRTRLRFIYDKFMFGFIFCTPGNN